MKQRIQSIILPLLILFLAMGCTNADQSNLSKKWKKVYPGVWKNDSRKSPTYDLLSSSGSSPKTEILKTFKNSAFPLSKNEIEISQKNGKTYLSFPLERKEQIYGLGLNFKTVKRRGQIFRLHVDHYNGVDNGRNHAPVPFFVSSKGYGVLINAARYIDVYVGTGVRKNAKNPAVVKDRNMDPTWEPMPYSDNIEIIVPESGVDVILFAGDNMMEVVQKFNLYCGGGFIPPKWGLGFWHRTPTMYNQKKVTEEINNFKKKKFPLDVIGLEPGWHSKAYPCTFEWDSTRFPTPKQFTQKLLKKDHIRLNLWCNPYLWPGSDLDKKMEPYTGSHTVWNGTIPDYTIPEAQKVFQNHIKKHQLDLGISGFKIDEVDGLDRWLWPDYATFPSGLDGEQMRQTYGTLLMKTTNDAYRSKNERTYGLIRAANAGSVSYPYVIYNDYYNHKDFITALINSSFSGVLWTPEVRASKTSEEWVRRMQSVCFAPIAMLNAWANGTKPWSYPEVYEACQEVAFLRMQLLPYIYSTFAQYYLKGTPPFRAMELVDHQIKGGIKVSKKLDDTENPYAETASKDLKDQYMMGDYILVAPMFEGQKKREVLLPKGRWFDFYTGKLVGEGGKITVQCGLDKIPLFIKDGAIIPMIPKIRQTSEWTLETPITVRVYGNKSGSFELYNDDGSSLNYEKGDYSLIKLKRDGTSTSTEIINNGKWQPKHISWEFVTK
ncbi:DUF5110 domain-containing protein [Halosquirtibacter laminarini]|uniref:DUF5110 domain-containing protein n=1 Tax=Halosquirtibacter laminarini TaxID=3374600 RepID=A0AC61NLT3_9BACT|nr:DUF5110 domain-containing protein [Prolixibacteraceae bacterium]